MEVPLPGVNTFKYMARKILGIPISEFLMYPLIVRISVLDMHLGLEQDFVSHLKRL